MTMLFLKKWFGTSISKEDYKFISTITTSNKFSYAYLKEFYIAC